MDELKARLAALSQEEGGRRTIGLRTVQALAAENDLPIRAVEIAALEAGIAPRRYLRNLGTVGLDGQARLLRTTVAVVGLGGLGGYVTEALARVGVGHLVVIDGDVFEEHNLNRQILSRESLLGQPKAEVARRRVDAINKAVEVTAHVEMLSAENLPRLLEGAEVVVDALDNLPLRLVLQEGAQSLGLPLVHGSIAGFLGQVMTIFPGDAGLRGLYGDLADLPEHGLETELGTPPATPMAVAAWEAQEVVKILLGRGAVLRNRLLVLDMEAGAVEVLRLA